MDNERPVEPWSVRRWKQLEQLERLLIECESLNAGNCVIERMQRLIKGAKELRKWDMSGQQPSFVNFLREQARAGYKGRKRKAKE